MSAQQPTLISMAQYARKIGVNRSTICRQVKAGIIPLRSGGKIDPAEADQCREEQLQPNPARNQEPAAAGVTNTEPPAFFRGIEFFCSQIREVGKLQVLAALVQDCGVRNGVQAMEVTRALVYATNRLAAEFFEKEVGDPPGPRQFLRELDEWWENESEPEAAPRPRARKGKAK